MNKIYKVIYSKVKQCYIVVSELAKSQVKSSHGSNGQQKAALTMSVLLALGAFTFAFGPTTAEAEDKTDTTGWQFIGVWHKSSDEGNTSENYQSHDLTINNSGATGEHSIAIGVHTQAGPRTIVIGDRLATTSQDSVFIGSGYDANGVRQQAKGGSDVVVIGSSADATGTGSIALGYGATADPWKNVDDTNQTNANKNSNSIALGYKAQAENNNIAIGANSVATDAASKTAALYTGQAAAKSYVSVGTSSALRRITNVADGAADTDVATIAQLKKVADNKVAWKLTAAGDSNNASTVSAGDTVDFSVAKDSKSDGKDGTKDHSNLTISKENGTNKVNMTVGLSDNVILGQNASKKGGSLDVYQATADAKSDEEKNKDNQVYDQLGTHVRIDGSTVSVHYANGTKDSDARGVVLGVAKDALLDQNGNETSTSPLGYVYLTDNGKYYYIHGTTLKDDKDHKELTGRLVYDSEERGYNYIADLDDGLKVAGDTKGTTVTTSLNPEAKNNTLSITGGETDSSKLTTGNNIGVVATDATDATDTESGKLNIRLAKELTGITSISNQTTSGTTTIGAKIELDSNGTTTISGGDVDVSKNKITNLKNGEADTDAATVGQMNTAIGNAKTKYYSVKDGIQLGRFNTNADNTGADASNYAGLAAGYETGTTGIASTVAGSYSGITGSGLQGAAAVSLGTANINKNTNGGTYSGVANSIIGQGNMTTNSNAAIIIGAGNTITNSYKDVKIDTSKMKTGTMEDLADTLQNAVADSGAQVMAIGGGNKITSAYKTQVVGVGNTVSDTESNYVDGFNNIVKGGKSNYIIGAKNTLDSGSNNVIFGDNHKLSSKSNNIILGSADDKDKELTASDAVVIGHNADVQKDGGVAIGSDSVASVDKGEEGYDATTLTQSTDTTGTWKATNAAVSVGKADGSLTRQITGVAAGTADTDAVNVAQIKKLGSKIGLTDTLSVKYDKTGGSGSAGGSITDYSRITLKGHPGGTTILNLADGTREDAAVNFGQLRQKADLDAGNIGSHYTPDMKDENGDVIYYSDQWDTDSPYYVDENDSKYGTPVKETDKAKIEAAQRENENSWGTAIGTGKIADAKASDASSNGSQQLVTGGTVYSEVRPTDYGEEKNKTTYHYISPSNTTGANLAALDEGLAGVDSSSVKYDTKTVDGQSTVDKTKITLGDGTNDTTVTHVKSALADAKDSSGKAATIATATGDALKNAVNLGDLQTAYTALDSKAGAHTALTVEGGTQANGEKDKDSKNLYAGKNIQLHSDTDATTGKVTYDVKLAKDLTGITSISNQTTTGDKTTGAKITLGTDGKTTISGGDVNVSGNKITNIKAGEVKEKSTDAVNGDQLYNEQKARTDADTAINNKIGTFDNSKTYNYIDKTASISTNLTTLDTHVKKNTDDISNINTRIDTLDGNAVKYDDAAKSKITLAGSDGTTIDKVKDGTISATSKEAINGSQLNTEQEARKAADTAINNKIGSLDKDGNYIKKDDSISKNLSTLDGQVKTNADAIAKNTTAISEIKTTVDGLTDNAVQYDKDSNKSKITLAGQDGTTITNVKDGSVAKDSKDAVNGGQLYDEKTAREKADTEIKTDITKIKDGEGFTDKGKTVIKSLAQDAVDVKGSDNVTVTNETKDGTKTFTVKVDGNGKVASGDKGLISGDTIYNELRPTSDGSYIKTTNNTAQNLTNLDTQVKKTSDLINSDGKTIKIGGNDAATKVDVSGKDSSGNSTSRVITGVKTDSKDSTSAASVGYVNDMNAANTQQIYHDMNSAYSHVENDISRAAAGSNALAALHPMEFDPDDKAQYALGYGHYRNSNAGAVGVFYQPDENSMFSLGASFGNGDAGINAGVTVKFGPGGSDHHALTKTQMAKVINEQSKEIDMLKKENADKDKRIDALEQKVNEILAKVEKDKG